MMLADDGAQGYFRASRAPRYSLLFALPLLLGYEVLALALPRSETQGVRNGAEVVLRQGFHAAAGTWGDALFGAVVLGVAALLVARDVAANGAPTRARIYAFMTLESLALAAVFAVAASQITARVLHALHLMAIGGPPAVDLPTRLMVSLGAGIFEELLFRVVMVTALLWLGRVALGLGPRLSAAVAVVVSALIFSASHYVGPYGDKLELPSFLFRTVGGLLFSLIYVLRGFGIVAWTHALYDVGLLLLVGR